MSCSEIELHIYIHIADAPQGKRIDRSCAWKILCDSISVCAGEEESNPCMFPCPVSCGHVRAPARLTPAIGCEILITIFEYFNVRQHIFMLHDFSHVTPPELGSSYEVMLTMLDRWASEHRRHSVEAWPRCAKLSCWYTIMSPCAQPCLALLLLARERGAVHVCGCFHLDYGNLDSLMKRSLQHYQSHTEELRTRKKSGLER